MTARLPDCDTADARIVVSEYDDPDADVVDGVYECGYGC